VSLAASVDGTTYLAQVAGMAQGIPSSPSPSAPEPLPAVSLELRYGSARPTTHAVNDSSFLIGTVPGCDLRLPGASLPSVVCLLSRDASGVTLRRLAPVLPILVNGRPITTVSLADGDRVSIGPIELQASIDMRQQAAHEIDALRQENHAKQAPLLEAMRQKEKELAAARLDLETREATWRQERERIEQLKNVTQSEQAVAAHRELAELRQQLLESFQQRRDRLLAHQGALRHAARKLQARKRQFEDTLKQEADHKAALLARIEELTQERQRLDDRCRELEARQEQAAAELAKKLADFERREVKLAEDSKALEKGQTQHQNDLVRLDRLQASLDQREKEIRGQAEELERGFERLRHEAKELEEQATQMDEWHTKLVAEGEALAKRKEELDAASAQMHQRAADLEGQQAMLAGLRTRLERMREEVSREAKLLAEQRATQTAVEVDLQRRLKEAEDRRAAIENEAQLREREGSQFHERQAVLEEAVARLREAQEAVAQEDARLREREDALSGKASELEEQAALVKARAEQLSSLQERMAADREAIAQREAALTKAEQTLAALQEQLRRRSEELTTHQKAQAEQSRQYQETLANLDARRAEIERERQQAEERVALAQEELQRREQESERRVAEVEETRRTLAQREESLLRSIERLKEAGRAVGKRRKELMEERARTDADKQRVLAGLAQAHREFEAARDEVIDLQRQLPELELQAREAAERLAQTREQLRNHLAEVHAYTCQSREDLESLRAQVQAEAERVRQQEAAMHRDRDAHRLAVAAFRQQLIDWQGHVEELRRTLAHGETRLERKRAEVDAQVRAVDETSQRLARQAEELQQQERLVVERRGEVERHLEDMRQWYRQKLRELAGIRDNTGPDASPLVSTDIDAGQPERGILSLTGDVSPADRQLGDLLRSLELVDADTLTALLVEARRQRRSLRQLLLVGNYLTLYQMALIEAGNLDGLVLGPMRVIDRIRSTPMETVYRVFDPRRNEEAILRHLSEEEMLDAVHPDEFRQRFAAAAAIRHPHLAATLEVLDIAGRPAVLQEWLNGLPASDWPAFAGAPGVWYRMVNQAFLGLHTAQQAGLIHGHLNANRIMLTAEGVLKLCGFGEPEWLVERGEPTAEPDSLADVAALGSLAADWVAPAAQAKRSRAKSFSPALQTILDRLTASDPAQRYPSAAAVLDDLDRAGNNVPANATAWDRFIRQVREQVLDEAHRLSA
jgi:hypothetical protein